MKRILVLLSMCICALNLSAQDNTIQPVGVIQTNNGYELSNPQTEVWIDIRIAETRIVAGPYARYAQKMLGITVPVVSKTKWEIIEAKLGYIVHKSPSKVEQQNSLAATPVSSSSTLYFDENGFNKLSIDRTSAIIQSPEEMASQAAERIFEIRKYRYDLLTGNTEEPISGDGLAALLEELNRTEAALIELFVGKRTTSYTTQRIGVDASRATCIACRFDEGLGLLPSDNLSGTPLVVKFTAQLPSIEIAPTAAKGKTSQFIVAAIMKTSATMDKRQFDELTIPVFQQGEIITMPASK